MDPAPDGSPVAWGVGLLGGIFMMAAVVEPWTRWTVVADPAWAFPPDPSLSPWVRAALATALCSLVCAASLWVLRDEGSRRRLWTALGLGFLASLLISFPGHGGDGIGDLIRKSQALREGGNLFTGGELLGYLSYVALMNLSPLDWQASASAAARILGLIGVTGLLWLAWSLASNSDSPLARAQLTTALLTCPFLILLGPYPQSTTLMNALVPWFLASGLLALRGVGPQRTRHAALSGGFLGLAVAAHGAAWFLGLGAAWLTFALTRRSPRDAARFAGAFAVPAGLSFLIDASWHGRRASNWGFTELEPNTLLGHLGGPLGVLGGSDYFHRPFADELTAWVLSAAPSLGLGVVALIIVLARRSPWAGRGAEAVFLGLATLGAAVLWSTWELWERYPSDWDITAILALTSHTLVLLVISRLEGRVRLAALGVAAGSSSYSLISLAAIFAAG